MITPAGCQLIGRWRIIEADLWDRGYLGLGGPATKFRFGKAPGSVSAMK
ncbi:hypothetical protein [Mesorhizobium sp.]|nr:hypothetical protein [Mesorhizobium sp.]